jgi:glutamate 5-kinase
MLYNRIVIKLGTNLLTGNTNRLNLSVMSDLIQQIAKLHQDNQEIIIVSSGAVAAGRQKLGIYRKRKDIPFKQVLASVGQSQLMDTYEHLFSKYDIIVGQALLSKSDLSSRAGYLNARNTLLALIEFRVICVVNENDVVATDEIQEARFGDNDNLSAMVASLADADLLIILTDINGLYTANPQIDNNAKLVERVDKIDSRIQHMASCSAGIRGVGGMATKIEAAKLATACGIPVVIANGLKKGSLKKIVEGKKVGTLFSAASSKTESKKRWMLSGLASKGTLVVDSGASIAIVTYNKSLLPAGITDMEGKFQRGDVVNIIDQEGNRLGCGISNYSSSEIAVIKGVHSKLVSKKLGYEYGSEIIHRNTMAII